MSVRSSKAENFLSPEILKYQTRDSGCNFSAVGSSGVLFMKRKAQKQTFEKLNRDFKVHVEKTTAAARINHCDVKLLN